ncbi:hypothetical protein [Olivibacter ginsenosidimutans]|uniref:hypothetical protein n=1 Tax=Olivibacter ginsenosidimutans TaxID=1176537 RepID=UPI0031ED9AB4
MSLCYLEQSPTVVILHTPINPIAKEHSGLAAYPLRIFSYRLRDNSLSASYMLRPFFGVSPE